MIRVGVVGAAGRMGREVARAVAADPDLELVAAVDPSHAGQQVVEGITIADTLDALDRRRRRGRGRVHPPDRRPREHRAGASSTGSTSSPAPRGSIRIRTWAEQRDVGVFVAPELRDRRRADAAVRRAGGPVPARRRDHRAPPRRTSRTRRRGPRWRPRGGWRRHAAREPTTSPASSASTGARGGDVEGIRVHSVRLPGLGRAPGGHPRRPGADAHDPSRLHRLDVVHAGGGDGGEGRRVRVRASPSGWTPCWGRSEHAARRGLRPSRRRHVRRGGHGRAARRRSRLPVRPRPCHER